MEVIARERYDFIENVRDACFENQAFSETFTINLIVFS